jgi:hypothetical protein
LARKARRRLRARRRELQLSTTPPVASSGRASRDALDDSNGEVVAIATRRIEDVPTSTKTPIGKGSVAGWRRTNQQRRTELWSVAAP